MKIQILHNDNQKISGYESININNPNISEILSQITPACCTSIVINESLNYTKDNSSNNILQDIMSKLRKNGEIKVSILDFENWAVEYLKNTSILSIINDCLPDVQRIVDKNSIIEAANVFGISFYSIKKKNSMIIFEGIRN